MSDIYESWGRYPKHEPAQVEKLFWRGEIPDLNKFKQSVLPYGCGRSYGDSCLNDGGALLDVRGMNHFISFDDETGIMRAEAGCTLDQILRFIVPRGWFLSVTPGTKYITLGGAIANDVHGKNHHVAGTFGRHVIRFELLRSGGERMICSREENPEMFAATIGGLGLTGLITWVEFANRKVDSPYWAVESLKFDSIDEFFEINEESESKFDYTVSWVDCTATGSNLGRGIYNRGNHAKPHEFAGLNIESKEPVAFPFDAPFINSASTQAFNILYYNKQLDKRVRSVMHYDPFFYPLDGVLHWNRAYGKKGFLQYQFVVPFGEERAFRHLLRHVAGTGMTSFLTVMKTFGDIESPGMLSFPRPGVNMAIDFRFAGQRTLRAVNELDNIIRSSGGVIYPAKDARMSPGDFRRGYPRYEEFVEYIDPKFSSSFWRRVMGDYE
ncbi:MAG: FAD-dependent oxidoreductase [Candidatus Kapaibacterium sp.]